MPRSHTHSPRLAAPSVEPFGEAVADWVPFPNASKGQRRRSRETADAVRATRPDSTSTPAIEVVASRLKAAGIHSSTLLTAGPIMDLLHSFTDYHDHLRRWMPRSEGADVLAFAITQIEEAVRAASRCDTFMTPVEAARVLGVSPSTITLRIRRGLLPAERRGCRWWIQRRALNESLHE